MKFIHFCQVKPDIALPGAYSTLTLTMKPEHREIRLVVRIVHLHEAACLWRAA